MCWNQKAVRESESSANPSTFGAETDGQIRLLKHPPRNLSLPDAAPLSDRPRCGGRESKFLAASGRRSLPDLQSLRPHPLADPQPHHHR